MEVTNIVLKQTVLTTLTLGRLREAKEGCVVLWGAKAGCGEAVRISGAMLHYGRLWKAKRSCCGRLEKARLGWWRL